MAVGLPWFILLITLIVGAQAGLISINGYGEFKTQSAGVAKVVLLITCTSACSTCPTVQSQVASRCAANPDIKCFVDNIGDLDGEHDESYENSKYSPSYIPFALFILNGVPKIALNTANPGDDTKIVNDGFAALGAK